MCSYNIKLLSPVMKTALCSCIYCIRELKYIPLRQPFPVQDLLDAVELRTRRSSSTTFTDSPAHSRHRGSPLHYYLPGNDSTHAKTHAQSMRSILDRCTSSENGCSRVSYPSSSPQRTHAGGTVGPSVAHALVSLAAIGCTHSRQWEWQEFTLFQSARAQVCHTHQQHLSSPQAFPCAR